MKKCIKCGEELTGKKIKYCSTNCRCLDFYHKNKSTKKEEIIEFVCENYFCMKKCKVKKRSFTRFGNKKECKECRKWKKKCSVCKKWHNKQGKTCSSECASVLKKESYMLSCGAEHNLSSESKSREKMKEKLIEKYGVDNVFQRNDVKEKIKETLLKKYGVDNPSKSIEILNKKLLTMIDRGITVPLEERDKFDIYRSNCLSFTNFNLKKFGKRKFGNDWEKERGINKKHIDHMISIKEGYDLNIKPEVIGSICNLQFINGAKNIKKGSKSCLSKENLIKEFNILMENNMNYNLELRKKLKKIKRYYEN